MYNDVGKEIKKLAEILVVLATIPAVLVAIVIFVVCASADGLWAFLGLVAGAVIIGVTYFFARLGKLLLYGYGDLIDEVKMIGQKVSPQKKSDPKPNHKSKSKPNPDMDDIIPAPDPIVERNEDGTWTCWSCNHINAANAKSCAKCDLIPNLK